jgi:outer membrane protein TolC
MKTSKITLPLFLLAAAACPAAAQPLDFTRSVSLAVQNNLYMKLARASDEAGRAEALAAASSLLPLVDLSISQTRTFNENVTALGFGYLPGGGVYMTGPFSTFDARLRLVQTLLNFSAADNYRSKAEEKRAAELRVDLATEQVSAAAALAYLEVLRSSAAVSSARSGLQLASSLRGLAERKHEAGTATGLDVLRARTTESGESLRVSRAQTALEEALLRLKHLLGLNMTGDIGLSETLVYTRYEAPKAQDAVNEALSGRLEMRIARAEFSAGVYALSAAKSARAPSLDLAGDAAMSGTEPNNSAKLVGDLGIALRMPLYEGGRVGAGIRLAQAAKSRAENLLEDASAQVQEETLTALYRLKASAEEVETASMTVTTASQELEMASNRFAAGAGDNIELVNAQTSLSSAKDDLVDAISRNKEANIRLTLALGRMKDLKF